MKRYAIPAIVGLAVALGACGGDNGNQTAADENAPAAAEQTPATQPATGQVSSDILDLTNGAASELQKMESDPDLNQMLQNAKGVLLVPDYGRGAFVVGASGGEGVLIANNGGQWSSPAFYNIGSVSVGAQIGGSGGQIAMLLMSDDALNSFKGDNTFSLNADAGLTIIDYSGRGQASAGKGGDVILWSDTEGAFVGASLSASDISFDEEQNQNFYGGQQVTAQQILSGQATPATTTQLQQAVPGGAATGTQPQEQY